VSICTREASYEQRNSPLYQRSNAGREAGSLRNDTYFSVRTPLTTQAADLQSSRDTITGVAPVPQSAIASFVTEANSFDQNIEPQLGYAVDEAPAQSNLEVVGVEPLPASMTWAGIWPD
jgi:hypothetical protein